MAAPTNDLDTRFWFQHSNGQRLYPYRLVNRNTGKATFRVAKPGTGANRKENQIELDDVEDVYRHVFGHGWSVRLRGHDPKLNGLYNAKGYSIVRTSES
ncbi:hypothetical protein [Pseudoxanthomonas koreensis]|uniref:hypothetical protein n=1 Tax=Pseudoxanthomonas koreensis TaxID=266061 RepID=UPI0035A650A3